MRKTPLGDLTCRKRAIIREPGEYPFLNCGCGRKLNMGITSIEGHPVTHLCECGTEYDNEGWIVSTPVQTDARKLATALTEGRRVRKNRARRQRDQVRRDMGLVKVKSALGNTFWE